MRGVEQVRMKTIDRVGVVEKLKELKTRICTSCGRKMGNFLSVSNKFVSYNYLRWCFLSIVPV